MAEPNGAGLEAAMMLLADEAAQDSLQAKINEAAAQSDANVVVLDKDYTESIVIPQGKAITLNLNGYTLTPDPEQKTLAGSTGDWNTVSVFGSLTLQDGSEAKTGAIQNAVNSDNTSMAGFRGVAVAGGGTFAMESGTICGFSVQGNGGGICVNNDGAVTLAGGTIRGNASGGSGGGLFIYDGSKSKLGGGAIITGNTASGSGGGAAIYQIPGTEFVLDSDTFQLTDNQAGADGGGLWIKSADNVHIGGTYTGNQAGAAGGAFAAGRLLACKITGTMQGNHAGTAGGGFSIGAGSSVIIENGAQIIQNECVTGGGGGRVESSNTQKSTFAMTGGRVGENHTTEEGTAPAGGGLMFGDYAAISLGGAAQIDQNETSGYGGGFSAGTNSVLTMEGSCMLRDNHAYSGGGLYMGAAAAATMSGGMLSGNRAEGHGGGGYAASGAFVINNGEVSGNSAASGRGGGLYGGGTVELNGGVVKDNTSYDSGGGLYAAVLRLREGCSVTGNQQTSPNYSYGGGACVTSALEMTGGEVSGNSACNGGGLCCTGNSARCTVISGGRIVGNTARSDGGGMFCNQIEMTGGEISGNTAKAAGGGVRVCAGSITGGKITANQGASGGGIGKPGTNTELRIGGEMRIADNTAKNGGGVLISDGTVVMEGGIVTGNHATSYGGGIYIGSFSNRVIGLAVTAGRLYGNASGQALGGNDVHARGGNASTMASRLYLVQASALTTEEGLCGSDWYEETTGKACEEAINESDNPSRTNTLCFTFRYVVDQVAEINGVVYSSVQAAADSLTGNTTGAVIRLLKNSRECMVAGTADSTAEPVVSTKFTLDLNGYALVGNGGSVIKVKPDADLTIMDSSAAQTGRITGGTGSTREGFSNDNPAWRFGGGLYIEGCATLESGSITGNSASGSGYHGGGVYIGRDGRFVMNGGRITGNTCRGVSLGYADVGSVVFELHGGEIFGNADGGVCISNDNSVFNMTGGAIKENAGSGLTVSRGTARMTGGCINGNESLNYGGGVSMGSDTSVFTLEGGEISGNKAVNYGGGIGVTSGTLNIWGGIIQGNLAGLSGGGIYAYSNRSSSINIESKTEEVCITGNRARKENGGGICNMGAKAFRVISGRIYENECDLPGRDIYSVKGSSISLFAASDMQLPEYNCWLDGDAEAFPVYIETEIQEVESPFAAHTYQLAAAFRKTSEENAVARIGETRYTTLQEAVDAAASEGDVIHLLQNCTDYAVIPSSKAVALNLNGRTLTGAVSNALYVRGSLTLQDDTSQADYDAAGGGGTVAMEAGRTQGRAAYVASGGVLKIAGGVLRGFSGMEFGGAVLVRSGGKVEMTGGTISENEADYGGAVCLFAQNNAEADMSFSMIDGIMERNTARISGGAVCLWSQTAKAPTHFSVSGGVLLGNTAQIDGGAVYATNEKCWEQLHTFVLRGCTLQENTAVSGAGGAVCYDGSGNSGEQYDRTKMELDGAAIGRNTAGGTGGGVYVKGIQTFLMQPEVLIEENRAAAGGGLWCTVNNSDQRSITVNGGSVKGNTALTGNAGGAYFSGPIEINDITVSGNAAKGVSGYGGGLQLNAPTNTDIRFEKGLIEGNTAGFYGGGVHAVLAGGRFEMEKEVQISGNQADQYGGGLIAGGNGTYTLCGTIEKNHALYGGGVANRQYASTDKAMLVFDGARLTGNTAARDGGGIFFSVTSAEIVVQGNTQITDNCALRGGGIFDDTRGSLRISGGEISGNTANNDGGGIEKTKGLLQATGGKISDNTANNGGGIYVSISDYSYYEAGNRVTVELSGSEISGNIAKYGGGVFNGSFCENTRMTGGVVTGNTARVRGGGVFVESKRSHFILAGGRICDNAAGFGQDVFAKYDDAQYRGGNPSVLSLPAAAEMFSEADSRAGIGWYDENTGRVYENALEYNPVRKNWAYTLKYRSKTVIAKINETEYISLQDAVDAIADGTYVDVEEPVILLVDDTRECVTVPGDVRAVLNLNGHTVRGMTTAFRVYGSLRIRDEKTEDLPGAGTGTVTGESYTTGGGICIYSGGYVKLESGQISDCKAAQTTDINSGGAGVYADGGAFELAGGSISNCYASYGAAVYVRGGSGSFRMTGGVIEQNQANARGAVFVYGGTFEMTDGEIKNNTASFGGGVCVNSGIARVYGGVITGNIASEAGGGIFAEKGTVRLRDVAITKNRVTKELMEKADLYGNGGGVYQYNGTLYIGKNTFVKENTARRGGGVYVRYGTVQMTGGEICYNTANRGGGVAQSATLRSDFTLSQGMICDNRSTEEINGNDIYSLYEGSDDYATAVKGENKPRMTLIPAARMQHPYYNVWKDDSYTGTVLEAETIGQGRYITAMIVESNSLRLTAAHYGDAKEESVSTRKEVQSLKIATKEGADGMEDGKAEFDAAAADKEKTAEQMLDSGAAGWAESDQTYAPSMYEIEDTPLHMIAHDGKLYERAQAVEWSAGDDSRGNNDIVRTNDTVTYVLTTTIGEKEAGTVEEEETVGAEAALQETSVAEAEENVQQTPMMDEPETLQLWIEAELPCSAQEAVFDSHGLDFYYTDETTDGGQLLRGYWEIENKRGMEQKNISVAIRNMKNGDTLKPVFREWIKGNPDNEKMPKERASRILTISAAPRYNVTLQRNSELAYTSYFDLSTGEEATKEAIDAYEAAVEAGEAPNENIVYGTMLGYGLTLSLYNDRSPERRSQSMKGIEVPAGSIEFDVTLGGTLYMNSEQITDETGETLASTPVLWAYKENTDSEFGMALNRTGFGFNMDWNDEDDVSRTTRYAWDAAPFNSGGGSNSCYSGGTWNAQPGNTDEQQKRVTAHFQVSGYTFDNPGKSDPSQTANRVTSTLFSPAQIKPFSAGYMQVIYPVDMKTVKQYQVDHDISTAFIEINMEGMVSKLNAQSASGAEPVSTQTKGIDVMQNYYGDAYPEYATDEMNYVDNYMKHSSGLYSFLGGGNGDQLLKTNYFNMADDTKLTEDRGTGSTPIDSQVYIGADVQFSSHVFDTTDSQNVHYNEQFDEQVDNRIEYNYMTAMNLLQKFDAEAYTPVGAPAVIDQRYEPGGQKCTVAEGAFTVYTSETATTWSSRPYRTQSYNLTILYAAKPNGENWISQTISGAEDGTIRTDGGTADMDQYTEENLIYFRTLQELYDYFGYDENGSSKGHCVAILYQFRDCCIRTGRQISVHSKMNVTNEFEKTGETYATTNDARCWSTYRPTYKKYYADGKLDQVTQQFNWVNVPYGESGTVYGSGSLDLTSEVQLRAQSNGEEYMKVTVPAPDEADNRVAQLTQQYFNGYIKTQYENGSKLDGTHNGWYSGNTLLLYTMESSIFIENTDLISGGNGIKTDYNLSDGERTVNFMVTPKINISSSVKDNELVMNGSQSTEVELTLELPKYLNYTAGSLEFDYSSPECRYEEGDLAWEIEVIPHSDGTTILKLKTYISDIDNGLPAIRYSCLIGSPDDPEKDVPEDKNVTLTTTAEINTTYEEINRITCAAHSDETSIRVFRDKSDYIYKTVKENLTELGGDLSYDLHFKNDDPSVSASPEILDILPYNEDGRSTSFHGGYRVKRVELTFYDKENYETYLNGKTTGTDEGGTEVGNTDVASGVLKIQSGLERPENSEQAEQTRMLNDARDGSGWTKYEISYCSFDTATETGKIIYELSDNLADQLTQFASSRTGIGLFCKIPAVAGDKRVTVSVVLTPLDRTEKALISEKGSQQTGNDIYWNNFIYRSSNATPVVSGKVFVRTADRTISGLAWMDQNQDGIYTVGSGAFVSSDRLLRGIRTALYSRDDTQLQAAIAKGSIVSSGEGAWSPTADTSRIYRTIKVNDGIYYPAVDVLGNLVQPMETDAKGTYIFKQLAAGTYFVVFDCDGYQVATAANPSSASQYEDGAVPFGRLSVTPKRDTAVYTKPILPTDKAMPDYAGVPDSNTSGAAQLNRAYITNGGGGIVLPELSEVQLGHYVTNRWNLGLYYIDLTLVKEWLQTQCVPQDSGIKLDVTATIGEHVSYTARSYTLKQTAVWNSLTCSTSGTENGSMPVAGVQVTRDEEAPSVTWTVSGQALQAQGAGSDGSGETIQYSFTETAKDAEGNPLVGYVMETDTFTAQSMKRTYTARNTQIAYDITVTKLGRGAGEGAAENPLSNAQYTLYTDEECTNPVTDPGAQTTGSTGRLTFPKMESGTWYLKETKTPSGYTLSKAVFKIAITYNKLENGETSHIPAIAVTQIRDADGKEMNLSLQKENPSGDGKPVPDGCYTVDPDPLRVEEGTTPVSYTISFSVKDISIYELPKTGGRGIWWNTLAGVSLMLAALWMMDKNKKKERISL